MNSAVHLLLKTRNTAFKYMIYDKEGIYQIYDMEAYSTARSNLKRVIRSAKHEHKLKSEENFDSYDSYDQKCIRASKASFILPSGCAHGQLRTPGFVVAADL